MINLYVNPRKSNSADMLKAFADGLKAHGESFQVVTDGDYRQGIGVFYGVQEETLGAWTKCRRMGTGFYLIDNGYFRSRWKGGDHYRITKNDWQVTGHGKSNGARWRALGLELKPWRKMQGRPLIALQSAWWYEIRNTTFLAWKESVMAKMKAAGWPEPVIRPKFEHKHPIEWDKVSVVVTHASNVAVDAALEGIPAVCTTRCAGGFADAKIEQWPNLPVIQDREAWASVLADNQFSVQEMRNGTAWRMLK